MSTVSLDDAKTFLNITTTRQDVELGLMLDAAERHVERYVGSLSAQTVTEVFYKHNPVVVLRTMPVISLQSVTVALYLGADAVDDTVGWVLDPSTGVLRHQLVGAQLGYYSSGSVITVTYLAGRATVPPDLRYAVLYTLRRMWNSQRGASALPAGAEEQQTPYAGSAGLLVPQEAMDLLVPHLLPPGAA